MAEASVTKWDAKSILEHLKQLAQEQLNLTPEQIAAVQPDAPLVDALRLDSLAQVVLMTAIEKDFACTFEPEELQQVHTVKDLVVVIVNKVSQEPVA